jgi:hypothetical protein
MCNALPNGLTFLVRYAKGLPHCIQALILCEAYSGSNQIELTHTVVELEQLHRAVGSNRGIMSA